MAFCPQAAAMRLESLARGGAGRAKLLLSRISAASAVVGRVPGATGFRA
ncbi:MAG: hypothetical protein ACKO2L_13370 [Planctomycetaceae bacterium]